MKTKYGWLEDETPLGYHEGKIIVTKDGNDFRQVEPSKQNEAMMMRPKTPQEQDLLKKYIERQKQMMQGE